MKSVLSGKRPPAKILEEIIEALSNTAHLLASESGPHGFEFAVLELSSRGATLPAKKQRATNSYFVLIVIGLIDPPTKGPVGRPDNSCNDNKDSENLDAYTNQMDPIAHCGLK